jgi:hypothetical protein
MPAPCYGNGNAWFMVMVVVAHGGTSRKSCYRCVVLLSLTPFLNLQIFRANSGNKRDRNWRVRGSGKSE